MTSVAAKVNANIKSHRFMLATAIGSLRPSQIRHFRNSRSRAYTGPLGSRRSPGAADPAVSGGWGDQAPFQPGEGGRTPGTGRIDIGTTFAHG